MKKLMLLFVLCSPLLAQDLFKRLDDNPTLPKGIPIYRSQSGVFHPKGPVYGGTKEVMEIYSAKIRSREQQIIFHKRLKFKKVDHKFLKRFVKNNDHLAKDMFNAFGVGEHSYKILRSSPGSVGADRDRMIVQALCDRYSAYDAYYFPASMKKDGERFHAEVAICPRMFKNKEDYTMSRLDGKKGIHRSPPRLKKLGKRLGTSFRALEQERGLGRIKRSLFDDEDCL